MERWRKLPWEIQLQRIQALAYKYNNAICMCDATGLGSAPVEALQSAGVNAMPIVFSMKSKMDILSTLSLDLEKGQVSFCPQEDTQEELKNYEMVQLPGGGYRLSAPPGEHDDCVIASALMRYGFGAQEQGCLVVPSLREEMTSAEIYN
jgi:hypothetical protein